MNIFAVDHDPYHAAQDLCDKHVVKMVLESAQMLSTAQHVLRSSSSSRGALLYKPTHINHPCNIWIRESRDNYMWLYSHYTALSQEYTKRYGKFHSSYHKNSLWLLLGDTEFMNFPSKGLTPFAIAMKNYPDCIKPDDPVESYRNYYRTAKKNIATWKHTPVPSWFY